MGELTSLQNCNLFNLIKRRFKKFKCWTVGQGAKIMKKILSAALVAGMLLSAVPLSYAGNAPLYLNHKLDTMTINTEKLENLETTHMLSNAFSFLSKGVKAAGKMVSSFFEAIDNDPCSPRKIRALRASIDETIARMDETIARIDAALALADEQMAELNRLYKKT
jgi:hypothetical protein